MLDTSAAKVLRPRRSVDVYEQWSNDTRRGRARRRRRRRWQRRHGVETSQHVTGSRRNSTQRFSRRQTSKDAPCSLRTPASRRRGIAMAMIACRSAFAWLGAGRTGQYGSAPAPLSAPANRKSVGLGPQVRRRERRCEDEMSRRIFSVQQETEKPRVRGCGGTNRGRRADTAATN